MTAGLLADAVLLLHAAFIAFVVFGSLLCLRWPAAALAHLPASAWGAYVELSGAVCPLTPLENMLRAAAGESGYSGGFIEHYLLPAIYPLGLTRELQCWLGAGVVVLNLALYGVVAWRWRKDS